jgi:hypothetical protein
MILFGHFVSRTDEQAPIPLIFDELVEIYWQLKDHEDAIFNCQMGRGRTTTGMIIATLIQIIAHRGLLSVVSRPPAEPVSSSEPDVDHFKNGNYSIIGKLIRILDYGNLAKKLADICIDYCDHMQNLRTAIYDFKMQLESSRFSDRDSREYKEHYRRGINYLVRYFYLIVFTNFLLNLARQYNGVEILDSMEKTPLKFSEWLESRKEIQKLASDPRIDFS